MGKNKRYLGINIMLLCAHKCPEMDETDIQHFLDKATVCRHTHTHTHLRTHERPNQNHALFNVTSIVFCCFETWINVRAVVIVAFRFNTGKNCLPRAHTHTSKYWQDFFLHSNQIDIRTGFTWKLFFFSPMTLRISSPSRCFWTNWKAEHITITDSQTQIVRWSAAITSPNMIRVTHCELFTSKLLFFTSIKKWSNLKSIKKEKK